VSATPVTPSSISTSQNTNSRCSSIVDAMEVRDASEVERVMVEHILAGKHRMLADHGAD
jgi:DNA-binding GntR family transcriptional regulator